MFPVWIRVNWLERLRDWIVSGSNGDVDDDDDDDVMVTSSDVHVGLELGRLIQQTRTQRKMSQKDLAAVSISIYPHFPPISLTLQKINEKAVVVVDYESGRALPNTHIISKLERALGMQPPPPPSLSLSINLSILSFCRCSSDRRKGGATETCWEGAGPHVTHSSLIISAAATVLQTPLFIIRLYYITFASKRGKYAMICFRILLLQKALAGIMS